MDTGGPRDSSCLALDKNKNTFVTYKDPAYALNLLTHVTRPAMPTPNTSRSTTTPYSDKTAPRPITSQYSSFSQRGHPQPTLIECPRRELEFSQGMHPHPSL